MIFARRVGESGMLLGGQRHERNPEGENAPVRGYSARAVNWLRPWLSPRARKLAGRLAALQFTQVIGLEVRFLPLRKRAGEAEVRGLELVEWCALLGPRVQIGRRATASLGKYGT